ncbi:polyprenyl synthetase family protein [Streptomyces sp. NPDC057428]|uniref:polyprenyl synthetase family protein n=1 Tax=Streptomyces sp. NPDC057428 TaxID=3346129 RepID=UPI0036C4ECDE
MTVVPPYWRSIRHRELKSRIVEGLSAVDTMMFDWSKNEQPLLATSAQHLLSAGGKRFRAALTLLAAQFGDADAPAVIKAATIVELTHLASLQHDDVMDRAHVRRGVPTVNARWGNRIAVRSGDFLLARSAQLAAELGADVILAQRSVLTRLVQGQILELQGPSPEEDALTHYLKVISDKTGSLIALAGRMGAMVAGAHPDIVEVFDTFGETLGLAFQLADDLLDISGNPASSGKRTGTDLRQGVDTLPVLLLRALPPDPHDPADSRLRVLLNGSLHNDRTHQEALELLRGHAAFQQAREYTTREAIKARQMVRELPRCPARTALLDLCQNAATRIA